MRKKIEELRHRICRILEMDFQYKIEGNEIQITPSKNPAFGDCSTNIAMKCAKDLGRNPREIGSHLANRLKEKDIDIDRISLEGPGFLNIYWSEDFLYRIVKRNASDYQRMLPLDRIPSFWKEIPGELLDKKALQDILYAHSRIHSVVHLWKEEGILLDEISEKEIAYEKTEDEKEILQKIRVFSQIAEESLHTQAPEVLLQYAVVLSREYLKKDMATLYRKLKPSILYGNLQIIESVRMILKTILEAFSIPAPEKL